MSLEDELVRVVQAIGTDVKGLTANKLDKTGGAVTGNVVFQVPNDGSLGFQFSGTDDAYGFNVEVFADAQGKLRNAYIGFPDGAGLTLSRETNTAWFSGWVGAAGGFGDVSSRLSTKVDKVAGMGLSTNDYTTEEKSKLAGVEDGANNYTHPANHPPSIITQDENNRFVTDAEKVAWNAKLNADDLSVTNAREWTATEVSQAEAEAGTATTARKWTAQRVRQAIAAWWSGIGTTFGKSLLAAADAAAGRTALGLGTAATVNVGSAPGVLPSNQHLGALAFLDTLGATQVTQHTRDSRPGDVWYEWVSNTQLEKKFHGFDGVIRTITETYA